MFIRCAVTFCAATAGAVAFGGEVATLSLDDLEPGSRFELTTEGAVYRGQLLNPATGETQMAVSADGRSFSEPQTVYLLGATQGRSSQAGGLMLVKMKQVEEGLRLELGVGSLDQSGRRITAPVKSIWVD